MAKGVGTAQQEQQQQPVAGGSTGAPVVPGGAPQAASNGGQPDYSAQWADYYRSLGMHKEAEAIEAQMKSKASANSQQ